MKSFPDLGEVFLRKQTAKMFHVKHLRRPFALETLTIMPLAG
jgi:hypothetical protein